ncbi:MAG: FAD-dependent oxidoreductase [Pseudomonadota bacterium]|nr:FAD-dependent oxidoreductase [Pseudomonadota bacterium]
MVLNENNNDSGVSDLKGNKNHLKIAIIGSGISGLSAAWLLNKNHEITLYEKNSYIGGHSNTAIIKIDEKIFPVDTGFIVFNPVNYPNLVALFDLLGVETTESNMSFSASLREGRFEYSGASLSGLFAQPKNIVNARFISMLWNIYKFYNHAPKLINDKSLQSTTLREFLVKFDYSDAFIFDHLIPMGAAIWSSSSKKMLDFPVLSFLQFFENHGLMKFFDRPKWLSIKGGSKIYVDKIVNEFSSRALIKQEVKRVERNGENISITTSNNEKKNYDYVVMACHADQTLELLEDPTDDEIEVLGSFKYQSNKVVLHTDINLLPKSKKAWSSWNYIGVGDDFKNQKLCVTYLMNHLQQLPTQKPIMVTLNPSKQIAPDKILNEYQYEHPLFDINAMYSQKRLWDIQNINNTWFCGAYFGSGFHEDGLQSGLAVAEKLGGLKRPWSVSNQSGRIGL